MRAQQQRQQCEQIRGLINSKRSCSIWLFVESCTQLVLGARSAYFVSLCARLSARLGGPNYKKSGYVLNIDERAVIAANNNADLYEAVFLSHGLRYERLPFGFVARDQPPPYYAHLTALSHKAQNDICRQFKDVVQRFSGRAVMKDSFCQMDAQSERLEVLFDASWIWFGKDKQRPSCTWKRVKSNSDLQLWEDAWKQSGCPTDVKMFNEIFLNKGDIFIFGQKNRGVFEKGCIGNRSRNCIGLSNVFSISRSSRIYDQATAAVASIDPSLPIVGYEATENLEPACRNGFEIVSNLRVLVA